MRRLLVVADNSLIVEAIRIGLTQSDEFHLVGHANDRATTVRKLADMRPDVVLVDDAEGSEAVSDMVRAITEAAPHVVVIALTFVMDPRCLDAIFDAGAVAAISKATHPTSLATLIRETVEGHVVHIPVDFVGATDTGFREAANRDTEVGLAGTLTNREREVLQQVAAGASNREIAQTLWVTEQTVKFHLANVYRKLAVGNRTQASHVAHVSGLTDSKPIATTP